MFVYVIFLNFGMLQNQLKKKRKMELMNDDEKMSTV